jgi:hypothetical protein
MVTYLSLPVLVLVLVLVIVLVPKLLQVSRCL